MLAVVGISSLNAGRRLDETATEHFSKGSAETRKTRGTVTHHVQGLDRSLLAERTWLPIRTYACRAHRTTAVTPDLLFDHVHTLLRKGAFELGLTPCR